VVGPGESMAWCFDSRAENPVRVFNTEDLSGCSCSLQSLFSIAPSSLPQPRLHASPVASTLNPHRETLHAQAEVVMRACVRVSEHARGVGGVFTPCDMDLPVCDACVQRQRKDEPLGNLAGDLVGPALIPATRDMPFLPRGGGVQILG